MGLYMQHGAPQEAGPGAQAGGLWDGGLVAGGSGGGEPRVVEVRRVVGSWFHVFNMRLLLETLLMELLKKGLGFGIWDLGFGL